MSAAGKKLIAAAMEAVAYAKCRHKWVRLSTRVQDGRIVRTVSRCEKCKVLQTVSDPNADT